MKLIICILLSLLFYACTPNMINHYDARVTKHAYMTVKNGVTISEEKTTFTYNGTTEQLPNRFTLDPGTDIPLNLLLAYEGCYGIKDILELGIAYNGVSTKVRLLNINDRFHMSLYGKVGGGVSINNFESKTRETGVLQTLILPGFNNTLAVTTGGLVERNYLLWTIIHPNLMYEGRKNYLYATSCATIPISLALSIQNFNIALGAKFPVYLFNEKFTLSDRTQDWDESLYLSKSNHINRSVSLTVGYQFKI